MITKRIDWQKITKEFVQGNFETVAEYIRYSDRQRDIEGETERPKRDAINKMSKKLDWKLLKQKRGEKQVENIVSKGLDEVTKEQIAKMVEEKSMVNRALLNMLVHFAKNPQQIHMRADLSDLVNDAKRGLGMVTKEIESRPSVSGQMTQVNIDADSFRTQIETAEPDELKKIQETTANRFNGLKNSIPVDQLAYVEEDE